MSRALIALGANLGDRQAAIDAAVDALAHRAAASPPRASRSITTRPIGGPPDQPDFFNAAAAFDTKLPADELLAELQRIEQQLGRTRGARWDARTLDLDLLLYDDLLCATPTLQVPHPRMTFRRFVLEPAAEVAPDMLHPLVGWTVAELLDHVRQARPYLAILGPELAACQQLAAAVSTARDAFFLPPPPGAASPDSSGPSLTAPIQLLDQFANSLQHAQARSSRLIVNGAYREQCLAEIRLHAAGQPPLRSRPKLLAVLDSWEALLAACTGKHSLTPWQQTLRWAAARDQPLVCVGTGSIETQQAEIAAALDAMHS